jgi:hypothetical protein
LLNFQEGGSFSKGNSAKSIAVNPANLTGDDAHMDESDDDGPPTELPIARHKSGTSTLGSQTQEDASKTEKMFEFLGFTLGAGQTNLYAFNFF